MNRKTTSELIRFFDDMYEYNLSSLKEYVENKEQREKEGVMTGSLEHHKVVSRNEWLEARKMLLNKEKGFTILSDQLSQERRNLPWIAVDKEYIFEGPKEKKLYQSFLMEEAN